MAFIAAAHRQDFGMSYLRSDYEKTRQFYAAPTRGWSHELRTATTSSQISAICIGIAGDNILVVFINPVWVRSALYSRR